MRRLKLWHVAAAAIVVLGFGFGTAEAQRMSENDGFAVAVKIDWHKTAALLGGPTMWVLFV